MVCSGYGRKQLKGVNGVLRTRGRSQHVFGALLVTVALLETSIATASVASASLPAKAAAGAPSPAELNPDPLRNLLAPTTSLRGTKPDIVLIVTDDQTLESLEYMPYVQGQIDDGTAINFTRAEGNNPLCCPGRATILTGQVDTRTGVQNNAQAANIRPAETVGPALQSVGYRTGIFGKLLNGYTGATGVWPGWDDFQALKPRNLYNQYNYEMLNNGVLEAYGDAPEDYQVDVLTAKSLDFIDQTPADQPLFLYVAPTATHTPFVAAPRHEGAYATTPVTLPANWGEADVSDKPAWVQQLPIRGEPGAMNVRRRQYEAALGVDDMVRSIDERLAATGRLDNTVLVFIGDNGLSQGSNRWTSKMCELRGCVAVPLVVRYPGQAGRTERRLVSNIDIAPTIVDLAGTSLPVTPDGISLVSALEDPTGSVRTHAGLLQHWPGGSEKGSYASSRYPTPGFYGIRTPRWRYVEVTNLAVLPGKTEYELYDERDDPGEMENLGSDPAYAAIRAALQAQLYDLVRATGATPGVPQGSWRPSPSGGG